MGKGPSKKKIFDRAYNKAAVILPGGPNTLTLTEFLVLTRAINGAR